MRFYSTDPTYTKYMELHEVLSRIVAGLTLQIGYEVCVMRLRNVYWVSFNTNEDIQFIIEITEVSVCVICKNHRSMHVATQVALELKCPLIDKNDMPVPLDNVR